MRRARGDSDGKVGTLIAGVGTGGTSTGCAQHLEEHKCNVKAVLACAFLCLLMAVPNSQRVDLKFSCAS